MLRFLSMIVIAATLLLATTLYQLKYQARNHLLTVQRLERLIDEEQRKLAVLWAEYGLLTSPENLEKRARAAGMRPLTADNIIKEEEIGRLGFREGLLQRDELRRFLSKSQKSASTKGERNQ